MKTLPRLLPLLLLGLVVVLLSGQFAPYCMDEFLQYNEIIYHHYPNNSLNAFNAAPGLYDLDLFGSGIVLPLRCYDYMGVVPTLYYYPLFLLWQDPLSARFLGILFLLAQAALYGRILGVRVELMFLGLLAFFPYAFQHIVETGMVGPQIVCLLGLILLIERWTRKPRVRLALGLAVVTFIGVWVKLSFLWYAPALLAILGGALGSKRRAWKDGRLRARAATQLGVALLLLLALSSVLFLSTEPGNPDIRPYWNQVFHSEYSASYALGELLDPAVLTSLEIYPTLWNPLRATERIFSPAESGLGGLLFSLLLYLAGPLLWIPLARIGSPAARSALRRSAMFYGCFWITLLMIFRTRESWSMHHTVLTYPFLILTVLTAWVALARTSADERPAAGARRLGACAAAIFFAWNGYYYLVFPSQRVDAENDPSRIAINQRLGEDALARDYFYVVLDWGMYYYQALYGSREQSVLYIDPLMPEQVTELRRLEQRTGRRALFLYHPRLPGHNLYTLGRQFDVVPCDLTGSSAADGDGWQVLIERPAPRDVCR